MKLLKGLAVVVVLLAALLLVGGALLSPKFTVTRSELIQASADQIYALIADPRSWKEWSAWNRRDPAMAIEYSGPASGVGAKWSWKSQTQGDGSMTFTAAEPARRVAFDLHFADFDSTSRGELRLAPEGTAIRVTWTMHGDLGSNWLLRWMTLLMDRMVGADFSEGLANLKTLAERA
jgi:Polyketide cyclase / dehydrase and lipid transport